VGKKKTPSPPKLITPLEQLTPQERQQREQLGGISGQFIDLLGQTPGQFQQAFGQQAGLQPGRLQAATEFEAQARQLLPQASVLSPEFQAQLDKRIGTLKTQAQTTLQDIFRPAEERATTDIFRRLGGMRSSLAGDVIGQLQQQKGRTAQNLALSIEAQRAAQEQQQLANQQAALQNLLGGAATFRGLATQPASQALGAAGTGLGLAQGTQANQLAQAQNIANAINQQRLQQFQIAQQQPKGGGLAGALTGGLGGASTGAMIGSMLFPGIGTAIGAGLGAAAGGVAGAS